MEHTKKCKKHSIDPILSTADYDSCFSVYCKKCYPDAFLKYGTQDNPQEYESKKEAIEQWQSNN